MMSWSPTIARTAGLALVRLWFDSEWRASPLAPRFKARLLEMIAADDDIQRLRGAEVVHLLDTDSPQFALDLIRTRLEVETNSHVAAVLMRRLSVFRYGQPEEVDSLLADVVRHEPWASVLAPSASGEDKDNARVLVPLVLWLAFRRRTAFATRTVAAWSDAPTESEASRWSLHEVRDWLSLPTDDLDVRGRAFEFARAAASSLDSLVGSENDQDRVNEAFRAADALVQALYFSSGAYGEQGKAPIAQSEEFTVEALQLLNFLAEFRHPSIVHYLVQTAEHLAAIDPKGLFSVIHKAVRPDEPYAYDPIAARVTVGLIERYLAEYRDLVVSDQDLLTQIRTVLIAFAKAGWPSAVSLSYRLGAVFR